MSKTFKTIRTTDYELNDWLNGKGNWNFNDCDPSEWAVYTINAIPNTGWLIVSLVKEVV